MSILKKKPYIEEVLGSLTKADLTNLKSSLNKSTIDVELKLCVTGSEKLISSSLLPESGAYVKTCKCRINADTIVNGVIILTATKACLIGYDNGVWKSDIIPLYQLDLDKRVANLKNECLTADELRRVIGDSIDATPGEKDDWIEAMKEKVAQNSGTNTTEIGNHLEVDGNLTLNSISDFKTKDGTSFDGTGLLIVAEEDITIDGNEGWLVPNLTKDQVDEAFEALSEGIPVTIANADEEVFYKAVQGQNDTGKSDILINHYWLGYVDYQNTNTDVSITAHKTGESSNTWIDAEDATVDENGIISFQLSSANASKHIQLMFEVENTGVHFGGDAIVHPKDDDVCTACGIVLTDGNYIHFQVTNNSGLVAITFESQVVATTDTIKVHYKVLF